MDPSANANNFREFIKEISKTLMSQEKHRMLHLQNNLYEKVQYYLNRKDMNVKSSSPNRNNKLKNLHGDCWNYETNQFNTLMNDEILSPTFRLTSPMQSASTNQNFTTNSIASNGSASITYSITNKKPQTARVKTEEIKKKYEKFKIFLENNTYEEVESARNLIFGSDTMKMTKSPKTAALGVARPTISSQRRGHTKTAGQSQKI